MKRQFTTPLTYWVFSRHSIPMRSRMLYCTKEISRRISVDGCLLLDIKMNEGNAKRYNVSGGLGLISSKLNVEGPIVKDKASFLVTGRRTYADLFLKASDRFKENKLYFYDLNAKVNYRVGKKDRLFLSGYFGRDVLGVGQTFGFNWGN